MTSPGLADMINTYMNGLGVGAELTTTAKEVYDPRTQYLWKESLRLIRVGQRPAHLFTLEESFLEKDENPNEGPYGKWWLDNSGWKSDR